MAQPKITTAQLDLTKPDEAPQRTFQIVAQTKTNAFQEVFLDGASFAIYQADNTTSPDQFKITGNYTSTFPSGVSFFVSGSTGNDGTFTTVADATFSAGYTTIYVTNGSITTNEAAGFGTGFIGTGSRLVLPNNSTTLVTLFAAARPVTAEDTGAGFIEKGAFHRNILAASVNQVGTSVSDFSKEDMTGAPNVQLSADTTNGSVKIEFKGGSTNLVSWTGIVLIQQVII